MTHDQLRQAERAQEFDRWKRENSAPAVVSSALVRPSIGDEITFIHRADYTKTTRKRTAKVRHVYEDGKILVYLTFWQNQKGVFVMPENVLEVRPNAERSGPAAQDSAT